MVLFYFLSKVNAIGLLTHSYQKSCALRGMLFGQTERKSGVRTNTMLAKTQIMQKNMSREITQIDKKLRNT